MVSNKKFKKWIIAIVILIIIIVSLFYYFNFPKKQSFNVSTFLIKLNIPSGSENVINVKITNNENNANNFNVYFKGLDNTSFVNKNNFSLDSKKSIDLKLTFRSNKKVSEIYSGYFVVESSKEIKKIPVIISIEPNKDIPFTIVHESISEYDNVNPGGQFGIQSKIYNLDYKESSNIDVLYYIKDFSGNIIFSEDQSLVINEKLETTKIIDIPKNIDYGDYIFVTALVYNGTKIQTGTMFNVGEHNRFSLFNSSNYFIILIIIFILFIFILFFYFIKVNNALLRELKINQRNELKMNMNLISESKKELNKIKNIKERNEKLKDFKNVKTKLIKKIKTKQKNQRNLVKSLIKNGKNKNKIKRKLSEWKNKGYKMIESENEMKKFPDKNIKKRIDKFKKSGYRTDFLTK